VFVFKIVAKVAQVVLFVCYRGNQNLVMVIENGILHVENFIFSKQNQVDEICLETCQKILEKDYGNCLERFSMCVYSAI